MSPEEQFLAQLQLIERVIDSICRRHRCYGPEAEDFGSSVKLKLIDNDYAVLRKFQGKSLLATYLTTVISNLFRDHRIQQWGKWRPSAAAQRLGTEAVLLDQLLHRDSHTFDEAVTKLQTDYRVTLSPGELREIAIQLPSRTPRRQLEGDEQLQDVAGDDEVEDRVLDQDRADVLKKTEIALAEALERLPAEDRLIIKLRFDGFKVSQIAKTLGLRQRPLYSRIEKSLKQLRLALETEGLRRDAMRDVFGWKGFELRIDYAVDEEDDDDGSDGGNEGEGGEGGDNPSGEGKDGQSGEGKKASESRGSSNPGPSNPGGGL